jgi:hypothetical protein
MPLQVNEAVQKMLAQKKNDEAEAQQAKGRKNSLPRRRPVSCSSEVRERVESTGQARKVVGEAENADGGSPGKPHETRYKNSTQEAPARMTTPRLIHEGFFASTGILT